MRRDTPDPHRSRTRALKILFDADVRGEHPRDRLAAVDADPRALDLLDEVDVLDAVDAVEAGVVPPDGEREAAALQRARTRPVRLDPFTRRLVGGVADQLVGLDAVLGEHAIGWRVQRMPVIDRNVLRLAVWEMAHEDVPTAVVFDEALELTRAWSTERAVTFVNGVLAAVRRLGDAELRARLAAAPDLVDTGLDDHLLDPEAAEVTSDVDVSAFAEVGRGAGVGSASGGGGLRPPPDVGAAEIAFEDLLFAEDAGDDVGSLLADASPAADEASDVVVPAPGAWLVRLDSSPSAGARTGHWPDVLSRRASTRLPVGAFASEDRTRLEALPDGAWVVAYQAGVDPDARERPADRLVGVARVRRPRPAMPSASDASWDDPAGRDADPLLAAPASAAADVAPPGRVAAGTPDAPSGANTVPSGAYVAADPAVSVVAPTPGASATEAMDGPDATPSEAAPSDADPPATAPSDAVPADTSRSAGRPYDDMVATRAARGRRETRDGHATPVAPPSPVEADDEPEGGPQGPVVVLEAVGSFLPYVTLDDAPLELSALAANGPAVRQLDASDLALLRDATDDAVTAGTRGPLGLRLRRFGDTTIGSSAPPEDDDRR